MRLRSSLTDPAGKAPAENFVFQPQDTLLRGTDYNRDEWGTDLTFTKFQAPATPSTPANPGPQPSEGTAPHAENYTALLPAADAIGRVIILSVTQDNKATLTTQFLGKGDPIVETGTWAIEAGKLAVMLDSKSGGKETLVFSVDKTGALVLQDPVAAGYGAEGLTLKRTHSGNSTVVESNGVSIRFDLRLGQSAQGELIKAIPVTEGPALGGAMPATVRILFDGKKANDFFDPRLAQVLVWKTDDWTKLDPTTAKTVADLRTLLASKPVSLTSEIPVLPPIPAQQVFRAQPQVP